MSTSLPSFKPALEVRPPPSSRKPDPNRMKPVSVNWWALLIGCPSNPSHVVALATLDGGDWPKMSDPEAQKVEPRSRFALGCFTEEKAKQLRRKTVENSSFRDAMYHSAIATQLASDQPDQSNG